MAVHFALRMPMSRGNEIALVVVKLPCWRSELEYAFSVSWFAERCAASLLDSPLQFSVTPVMFEVATTQ